MAVVQGADLVEVVVDAGESGKSLNRPGEPCLSDTVWRPTACNWILTRANVRSSIKCIVYDEQARPCA
jgi:hypothetical protein